MVASRTSSWSVLHMVESFAVVGGLGGGWVLM